MTVNSYREVPHEGNRRKEPENIRPGSAGTVQNQKRQEKIKNQNSPLSVVKSTDSGLFVYNAVIAIPLFIGYNIYNAGRKKN